MDRINSLPDELVCHILSFLLTKEAALTSLLSKRWRNLFAFTPCLRFEENDFKYRTSDRDGPRSIIDFLDRVLAASGNFPIKNLSLNKYLGSVSSVHTNRWICNVLSRGALECLHVNAYDPVFTPHVNVFTKSVTSVPLEIFTCKTLVTLKLGIGFQMATLPENAFLPALKTLFIHSIRFSNYPVSAFEALLSACPVLKELEMRDVETPDWKHCTFSSPTLQRLTMNWITSPSITFDLPSLAYLDYHDILPKVYPVVNLGSLFKAELNLFSATTSTGNLENLIKGLRNVQILSLTSRVSMEIFYIFREAIPVFENLFQLSIPTVDQECCLALPLLLKNAPNLETLVIQGPLLDKYGNELGSIFEGLSGVFLLTCPVKVLQINIYGDTGLEKEQLKHFLENLTCLELVRIRSRATDEKECLQFTKDLLKLPRSSNSKIKFELIPSL